MPDSATAVMAAPAAPTATAARPFSLLLIEPYFVLRRTVACVAGGIDGMVVTDVPTLESAMQLVNFQRFDGFVMAMDGDARQGVLTLIERIRQGLTPSASLVGVAVTAERCDIETIQYLKSLNVQRILLKPFKVKTVLETVMGFAI